MRKARKPTVQGLIKKLKAKGELDLYWVDVCGVGVRTLHWVDELTVKVAYHREYPASNELPLESFLKNLIEDGEAETNYWLAYGRTLRLKQATRTA
jgi:hypothetical protein